MSRRERGTGTVELVGTRYRFKCQDGQGGRYTSPAEYETVPAATRGLAIYRRKVNAGEIIATGGLTLEQFVQENWLPRREQTHPSSIRTYRSLWKSQISKAPFVRLPLVVLKRRQIRAWAEMLKVEHPEHPLALLRKILADCVADDLIDFNPCDQVRMPTKRREQTCPTPEEQAAILGCSKIPTFARTIVAVGLGAGLRPMEWRRLRLDQVHLDAARPFLDIYKSKGGKSRMVPLFGLALEALRAWLPVLPDAYPKNPLGLVFPQVNGKLRRQGLPLGMVEHRDGWKVYLERAGVKRPIRLHDLRHAAGTDLLTGVRGRAWTLLEVQRLLGHASSSTTERFYFHGTNEIAFRAAEESGPVQSSGDANSLETRAPGLISKLSLSSLHSSRHRSSAAAHRARRGRHRSR